MDLNQATSPKKELLFKDLNGEGTPADATEIESLCLACGENGVTRLLLTKIPCYKEIIISSFSCPHCGHSNNDTQFGGTMQDLGIRFKLKVKDSKDLNRQVIRSEYATVMIPEIEFEIPPTMRNGEVTTLEGILEKAISNLVNDQPLRKIAEPEAAIKLEAFINVLKDCRSFKREFHFVLEDPSGNSVVENLNPIAPNKDESLETRRYKRSPEDNELLGLDNEEEEKINSANKETEDDLTDEVLTFQSNCSQCHAPCSTHMKVTKIPFFKEVVIMATNCDICGHRTNEVKSGSGIEPKGLKITLRVTDPSDLSRDVLKSETCEVRIPELDFEMSPGTLGGRFTTLEGLLQTVKTQLLQDFPFVSGDSAAEDSLLKMKEFAEKLDEIITCKKVVHFILDDPAGNSFIQNLYAPEVDPEMEIVEYERSFEQNEELGLNDIKVENYENDS
ncbi:nucleolar zinc-finger protein [Chamberlinius hualienensis]